MTISIEELKIKIFADGANFNSMLSYLDNKLVRGFTTNPSLMHAAGVKNYREFASNLIKKIPNHHLSFEVFADEFLEMEEQARQISSWGENVFAKIPITNSERETSCKILQKLSRDNIKVNVTAIFTVEQVKSVAAVLSPETPAVISIFAGRIADTGVNPVPIIKECIKILSCLPKTEVLWASTREVYNIFQANEVGCDIITVGPSILGNFSNVGRDLNDYSLETVKAFRNDAEKSEFSI